MLPVVALVGRPNVGKSTLFNQLTRSRDAIVADRPGVTRDRHYGICRDGARAFVVVDTGGLYGDGDELADLTFAQAEAAIAEADVVVLVCDARDGLMPGDRRILDDVRRRAKALVVAINKSDAADAIATLAEFAPLGVDPTLPISAAHRRGLDLLVAAVAARFPTSATDTHEELLTTPDDAIRLAIIGRPNVGKSTLVNRLLGEERVIVSDVAGTTRDAVEVPLKRDGQRFILIDTAGVRRRARVEDEVEKISVIKTLAAIESAEVVVVMFDASEGVTEQDVTVLGHALAAGRGIVIALNKWDGLDAYQRQRCEAELERRLDFVAWAPRVNISARHGSGLRELMDFVGQTARSGRFEASAAEITRAIEIAVEAYQPPLVRGKAPKLRYAHLGGHRPLRIVIHGSRLAHLAESYKRYLENFLRKRYRLVGTPIRLEWREGSNPFEGKRNELSERQQRKRQRLIRHAKRRSR
jgi:GTP-binding protein